MKKSNKLIVSFCACLIITIFGCSNAFAFDASSLSEGTYDVDASLSCYVNAMGGVEFGKPLLTKAFVTVDGDGNKKMTLNFTKSSVTIYNITCDTFVDVNPTSTDNSRGVTSGTIGYYDKNGNVQKAEYTLSDNTALNSRDEAVNYVDSMIFPLDQIADTYNLTIYINSNVMGVQFCNENNAAAEATYPAKLTVNWNSINLSSENLNSSSQYSNNSVVAENELETLPNKTQIEAQSVTEATTNEKNEVVEKDGLNIHYVNGENNNNTLGNTDDNDLYTAYLNFPALIAVAIGAGVVILVGAVFLISTSVKKERRQNK